MKITLIVAIILGFIFIVALVAFWPDKKQKK
jgi:hypothetical protein